MDSKEKIAYGLITLVVALVIASHLSPVRFLCVAGHSMEPKIEDGDLVVILPPDVGDIGSGDIIAFVKGKGRIIHKVIGFEDGRIRTMGINSPRKDPFLVEPSEVVGKHFLTVPYVGALLRVADSPAGFVLLVLLPASLLVYNESRKI